MRVSEAITIQPDVLQRFLISTTARRTSLCSAFRVTFEIDVQLQYNTVLLPTYVRIIYRCMYVFIDVLYVYNAYATYIQYVCTSQVHTSIIPTRVLRTPLTVLTRRSLKCQRAWANASAYRLVCKLHQHSPDLPGVSSIEICTFRSHQKHVSVWLLTPGYVCTLRSYRVTHQRQVDVCGCPFQSSLLAI